MPRATIGGSFSAALRALAVMGAITAVSPKLYSMFCRRPVTAARRSASRPTPAKFSIAFSPSASTATCHRIFLGNSSPTFTTMNVKIGETALAFFRATNMSDKPLTGQAAFNVAPQTMGLYFKKIECFCFTKQTLKPHQTVEMPVTFFIDPKMVDDSDTGTAFDVTLSYVFFPVENPADASRRCSWAGEDGRWLGVLKASVPRRNDKTSLKKQQETGSQYLSEARL